MAKRHIKKMLRRMGGGEPVSATTGLGALGALARLAFYAEQFGYQYADTGQGAGPDGQKVQIRIVPDPSPQGRARAAENWARYPDAADGGALPPLDADAVALLKARISFDLASRLTEKQKIGISVFGFSFLCLGLGVKTGIAVGVGVWAVLMALLVVGIFYSRRYTARTAALLEAAGLTLVTDRMGRQRYLPPTGQIG